MNDTAFVVSIFIFSAVVGSMITGWIGYQRGDKDWMTRARWAFTILVLLVAVIGYFTIVMRLSGYTWQPIKPARYEQIQEPVYRLIKLTH